MNKLIARLAASATLVASMGGSALASASLDLTGPDSTNIIDLSQTNRVNTNTLNWVMPINLSFQTARSGDVTIRHNTEAFGDGSGSGNASNTNNGDNSVVIANDSAGSPFVVGGVGHDASIDTTGPDSTNLIAERDSNRVTDNTFNSVRSLNANDQSATTGNIRISGNTIASGGGGSGDATNVNSGSNTVGISNQSTNGGLVSGFGGDTNASIAVTGPDSTNIIRTTNTQSFTQNTTNNVSSANFSDQTARSGNVTVSGNTIADGFGGSGDASNVNSGSNDTQISNN